MARGRVIKSAIDAALDNLSAGSKVAQEVIESTGKGATRAKMIKNSVNKVKTNMSNTTTKVLNEVGEGAVNAARREGIEAATNQVKARTAEKALNRTARQGNSAVQKSREFIESKKVNQVIDGHNAQSRQTAIDTIVNNVKDRNINRVPQGHETARNAVNRANETVRNARNVNPNPTPDNVEWPTGAKWSMNNEPQMPINNYQGPNTGPQASPIIRNQEINMNTGGNTGGGGNNAQQRYYNTQPEIEPKFDFDTNQQTINKPIEPEFNTGSGGNGSGGGGGGNQTASGGPETGGPNNKNKNNKRQKARERMNSEQWGERFGEFGEGVKDAFFGGIKDSYDNVRTGKQGIFEAIGNAHTNDDGSINWKRAAGSFMTVSAAGRIASGGGLYKDRYGNPNLIGVPFI